MIGVQLIGLRRNTGFSWYTGRIKDPRVGWLWKERTLFGNDVLPTLSYLFGKPFMLLLLRLN
jgi:hypothetical protein